MACCLTAPSHYLNQCWLIISKVLWHSSEGIIMRRSEDTNQSNKIENCSFKMASRSPRGQWVNWGAAACCRHLYLTSDRQRLGIRCSAVFINFHSCTHKHDHNIIFQSNHDDVIKWKHFPRYWPYVLPVNSPHEGQRRGALICFFDLRLNKRLSKQAQGWWFETPSCPLWRHCNVMARHNGNHPAIIWTECWGSYPVSLYMKLFSVQIHLFEQSWLISTSVIIYTRQRYTHRYTLLMIFEAIGMILKHIDSDKWRPNISGSNIGKP